MSFLFLFLFQRALGGSIFFVGVAGDPTPEGGSAPIYILDMWVSSISFLISPLPSNSYKSIIKFVGLSRMRED
jgi:hypothetical protein